MKKKKIIAIFLTLLIANVLTNTAISIKTEKETDNLNKLDGGWIEKINGVNILHISGSNYDMGYQIGTLLVDKIEIVQRIILNMVGKYGYTSSDLSSIYSKMENYIPEIYKQEMQGMADGSGISYDQFCQVLTFDSIFHDISCCGWSAWDTATNDGKLIHANSLDLPIFSMYDEETDTYIHDYQMLIVRNPDDGYASIYPFVPGLMIGNVGGINEKGIAVSSMVSWGFLDMTESGTPHCIRMSMVLDSTDNAEDAIEILNSNKDKGWNFIVSDSNASIGYAVEQTASHSYFGTWDDEGDVNSPWGSIENVVRRTNFFVYPSMAEIQREIYNPQNFLEYFINNKIKSIMGYYDSFDKYISWNYYIPIKHYESITTGIDNHWGNIGLNDTISTLRDIYSGKLMDPMTKFLVKDLLNYYKDTGFHQWVACPETGDMLITFANGEYSAENEYTEIHYFNFYELLDEEP